MLNKAPQSFAIIEIIISHSVGNLEEFLVIQKIDRSTPAK
jgi:hypothetical protein